MVNWKGELFPRAVPFSRQRLVASKLYHNTGFIQQCLKSSCLLAVYIIDSLCLSENRCKLGH